VRRDWHERGRIYLPHESWAKFGIENEEDFAANQTTNAMRQLVLQETARAKAWLLEGRPLVAELPWSLGRNLDLMVQGGLAIATKIEAVHGEVLQARPRVSKCDQALLLARTWWQWRGGRRPSFAPQNPHAIERHHPSSLAAAGSEVSR
jgi:phytoene/squalene synthetase